jgi:serine/threonine-protein kinase HipA
MTIASVHLWGRLIGAVSWQERKKIASFEYAGDFIESGIQIAPIKMPLSRRIYSFPSLPITTFHGLPGLLSDSLPDKFGNALIDAWLIAQGKPEMNAVERLCYEGTRGMGALEYEPETGPKARTAKRIDIEPLVELANEILKKRTDFKTSFDSHKRREALLEILSVGTSAGGARAKAVIAWNPLTNEVRSGQVAAGSGFSYWILKFDGVSANKDKEDLADPKGYGLIEYAYYKLALAAGIQMSECRIFEENGRSHFMTKRFDRTDSGGKIHMQSLCALAHFDFNSPTYSYEQAFNTIKQLKLPMSAVEEQFRRMAFNIIGRNQDDHVKNIAFLMNRAGSWSLSPAFDLAYAYNPSGIWTNEHQMSINGKRDGFTVDDIEACASLVSLKRGRAKEIFLEVEESFSTWPRVARNIGVPAARIGQISRTHRTIY